MSNVNIVYGGITTDIGTGFPVRGDNAYVHLAYANSADGVTDFTTSPVEDVVYTYMGQYSDYKTEASTDPSAYSWALLSNEAERASAESQRVIDEDTRIQNENLRNSQENARSSAEGIRKQSEAVRSSNESARTLAETSREKAESTRVSNETERVNAETKRASNETNRVSAESTRKTNETARADAETKRAEAETGRTDAEAKRAEAENTRTSNETNRVNAESTRSSNENTRINSETARANAESTRSSNENTRINNEAARVKAEAERGTNEGTRLSNETSRVSAETARATAETNRANAEAKRVSAETARATAEKTRSDAETARATAETNRVNAEAKRVSAETARATAETNRANAEAKRVSAETARETASATAVSNANTAATNAQKVADTIEASLNSEITARTEADTKLQADINSIAPTRSVCPNFVMQLPDPPELDDYIRHTQLFQTTATCDNLDYYDFTKIGQYTTNPVKKYYDDIYTAVSDINAGSFDNGSDTEVATGVMVYQFGEANYSDLTGGAVILRLLSDITLTSTLAIMKSCIIDFNGHKITADLSNFKEIGYHCRVAISVGWKYDEEGNSTYNADMSVVFYGTKTGSGIEFTHSVDDSNIRLFAIYVACRAATFMGGSYILTDSSKAISICLLVYCIYSNSTKNEIYSSIFYTDGVKMNVHMTASCPDTSGAFYAYVYEGRYNLTCLKRSNFAVTIDAGTPKYGLSTVIMQSSGGYVIVDECTITGSSPSTSSVQSIYGLNVKECSAWIHNSVISVSNCALSFIRGRHLLVSKCVLEGGEHGGAYISKLGMSSKYRHSATDEIPALIEREYLPFAYSTSISFQDTILRKIKNTSGNHDNPYSCYFGYGVSNIYCNNVTFDGYSDTCKRPSIKGGNSAGSSLTTVYFSNCSMNDIRVDAGTKAVLGAGISDTIRSKSVSGTIINKPNEIYQSSMFLLDSHKITYEEVTT